MADLLKQRYLEHQEIFVNKIKVVNLSEILKHAKTFA